MANEINITFPDGNAKKFPSGTSAFDIAGSISEGLQRATIAARINDELTDATTPITKDATVQLLTFRDEEGKQIFWHSSAHVLAQAVKELWPKTKLTVGPAIEQGFYYDFDMEKPFTPDDLITIEKKMKEIVDRKIDFKRETISKKDLLDLMKTKNETYKIEMIKEKVEGNETTVYHQDDFVDFCRGPHVPNTRMIKAFKLTKIAGAYWKGDAKNKMLQRIYGIAFPDKKDLKAHLQLIEEAEKRDHRKIGKELDLYSFHDEAPGMPFFHAKGQHIWDTLVDFVRGLLRERNYWLVKAPVILNKDLWLRSGHWDHYKENMYFTKIDDQDFAVKPMNCPGHMLIFRNAMHSYRDLPIRMGEFGLVHRHELSGVLSGLFRVRMFTQDDAHVFCKDIEQSKDEIKELLKLVDVIYGTFGFEYKMELSTRPEKAMGEKKLWDEAESVLKEVLDSTGREYVVNEGDGAFYGPKIDFHLKDAIGRTWQCGTIQLDFQMPEKFDLTYEGADGKKHRPIMLHRAILGSVERFMGILVEHYAGRFPLWISPSQVRILTVADRHNDYAQSLAEKMKAQGLSVDIDARAETIPKKVRDAQLDQFNYILVVGDKEVQDETVTVRTREGTVEGAQPSAAFIKRLVKEVAAKQ
jgi:threonyl-tRNA synthetase